MARGQSLNEHANFESFRFAMLTLFRVATHDEWVGVMADCAVRPPHCDAAAGTCGTIATYPFFLSFVIIVSIIMLNLLTAVIIENFENQQDHGEAQGATSTPYESAWFQCFSASI